VGEPENHSMLMRRISRFVGSGVISIVPLTQMAIGRDSHLSEKRDMEAAQLFFKQAWAAVGHTPERVTTDGHASYPRAVRETLGDQVLHRTNKYLNNRLEQDHRGVKQRYYPMHGFENFDSAARFCSAFDELRNYLRPRFTMEKPVSLSEQRQAFLDRLATLKEVLQAIS
jgi:putative transposase